MAAPTLSYCWHNDTVCAGTPTKIHCDIYIPNVKPKSVGKSVLMIIAVLII